MNRPFRTGQKQEAGVHLYMDVIVYDQIRKQPMFSLCIEYVISGGIRRIPERKVHSALGESQPAVRKINAKLDRRDGVESFGKKLPASISASIARTRSRAANDF